MKKLAYTILLSVLLAACGSDYLPKQTAYFRIDLPEKAYQTIDSLPFPFILEVPAYARPNLNRTKRDANYLDIDFPRFGARIHISNIEVRDNLPKLMNESRGLVYKHAIKAQDIQEQEIYHPEEDVYGSFYTISGNAASYAQFVLTDSSRYFVRGALYFNASPNYDSIAPVAEFIRQDMEHLVTQFKWKTNSPNVDKKTDGEL